MNKRLSNMEKKCILCGTYIDVTQPFKLLKLRVGHRIKYNIFHEKCYNLMLENTQTIQSNDINYIESL